MEGSSDDIDGVVQAMFRVLCDHQRACSAKCRAALSRRGQAERQQRRDQEVLTYLEHAERLEARAAELRALARKRLQETGC